MSIKEDSLKITPLKAAFLEEANALRDKVFGRGLSKDEKLTFDASIYPQKHEEVAHRLNVKDLSYFIVSIDDEVAGTIGLYTRVEDETLWIGWYCVGEEYRKNGIGRRLLDFIVKEAKKRDKKFLHVYTYDSKKYKVALDLYKRYGFEEYSNEDKIICLKLPL